MICTGVHRGYTLTKVDDSFSGGFRVDLGFPDSLEYEIQMDGHGVVALHLKRDPFMRPVKTESINSNGQSTKNVLDTDVRYTFLKHGQIYVVYINNKKMILKQSVLILTYVK